MAAPAEVVVAAVADTVAAEWAAVEWVVAESAVVVVDAPAVAAHRAAVAAHQAPVVDARVVALLVVGLPEPADAREVGPMAEMAESTTACMATPLGAIRTTSRAC